MTRPTDAERLDWLDKQREAEWHVEGQTESWPAGEQVLDGYYWAVRGQTYGVREAIDEAIAHESRSLYNHTSPNGSTVPSEVVDAVEVAAPRVPQEDTRHE